jgi:predicted nucleotidyltransferase
MHTSFDLSGVPALRSLATVAETLRDAAAGIVDRWLIVGATARDLVLQHAYGLPERRKTADLDVAVAVSSWEMFAALESRLLTLGAQRHPEVRHEFIVGDWKVDVIPFAGVAKNGVIRWPPDGQTELNVTGFAEASTNALDVILPGGIEVLVASPPGLLILKLIAWKDRHWRYPLRDGIDIRTLIDSYAEKWNQERLYGEADDLLEHFGFDTSRAGAALLGRDASAIAKPDTLQSVQAILEVETDVDALTLASDMGGRTDDNLDLLAALLFGVRLVQLGGTDPRAKAPRRRRPS